MLFQRNLMVVSAQQIAVWKRIQDVDFDVLINRIYKSLA